MSTKYVTEDNLNDILAGIGGKFLNIYNRVNIVKVELLNNPATLIVGSWGSVSLNREMTDFDEVEFEYKVIFGTNTQFRKFSVLKSSLLAMTSAGRCMDSFEMDAGVTSNTIDQYIGIIMKISSSDYKNPEFYTKFGGLLSSAYIELTSVRGINYSQSYGDTPIGTIINYMGLTPPEEYLACDGTTYNIQDYWELAEFIKSQFGSYNYFGGNGTTTFAVPDLRGEFLRGTGINSHTNQGSGASVGTHQDGTKHLRFGKNAHNSSEQRLWFQSNLPDSGNIVIPENFDSTFGNGATTGVAWAPGSTFGADGTTHYTSRPTNTSILYCIKYTNSPSMQPSNVYSTEEKRIGTWIDGKSLYQIALTGRTPSTADTNTNMIEVTSLNIDQVIELNGFITYDAGSGLIVNVPINSPRVTNNTHYTWFYIGEMMSSGNKVNHIKGQAGTNLINQPVHFVLKYTKK